MPFSRPGRGSRQSSTDRREREREREKEREREREKGEREESRVLYLQPVYSRRSNGGHADPTGTRGCRESNEVGEMHRAELGRRSVRDSSGFRISGKCRRAVEF